MSEFPNPALRDHVTSIGFSLTLSKRMIDVLVALDHFQGKFSALAQWEYEGDAELRQFRRKLFSHYVSTFHALEHRGLVIAQHEYKDGHRDIENSRHNLTVSGSRVVGLLKDAGIYQDRLKEMGMV